jgi:Tfp pilus assembly protein PilE
MKAGCNQLGFSLAEITIALGIVGALSAIGFAKWTSYHMMSLEVKIALTYLESSQGMATFRARYHQYFGDLRNIGYTVGGEQNAQTGFDVTAGGTGPVAPPSYRGPGAPAGEIAGILTNLQLCEQPGYSCINNGRSKTFCQLPDAICRFQADSFTACSSTRLDTGESLTKLLTIDERKVIEETLLFMVCLHN